MKHILPARPSTSVLVADYDTFGKNTNFASTNTEAFDQPQNLTTTNQQDMDLQHQPQLDLDAFATIATTVSPLPIASSGRRLSTNKGISQVSRASEDHVDMSPSISPSTFSSNIITPTLKSPRKRNNHNECERKRRDSIRLSFANLQARLPRFVSYSDGYIDRMNSGRLGRDIKKHNTGEMSKMQVLNSAIERIRKLKESIVQVNGEVDKLRRQVMDGQKELGNASVGSGNNAGTIKQPSPIRIVTLSGQ